MPLASHMKFGEAYVLLLGAGWRSSFSLEGDLPAANCMSERMMQILRGEESVWLTA